MSNKMSKSDASRIQSANAKSGGDMSRNGFASRAQSAADRNANAGSAGGSGNGGGGRGQAAAGLNPNASTFERGAGKK